MESCEVSINNVFFPFVRPLCSVHLPWVFLSIYFWASKFKIEWTSSRLRTSEVFLSASVARVAITCFLFCDHWVVNNWHVIHGCILQDKNCTCETTFLSHAGEFLNLIPHDMFYTENALAILYTTLILSNLTIVHFC